MASSPTVDILLTTQKYILFTGYIIFIAGIIGNLINILVFTTLKMFRNNQCVFYFISESLANIIQLFIFFMIRISTETHVTDPANDILFWCKFRGMIITLCTLISFSAICFSAYDQYLSTSHRFNLRTLSTLKLARILIFTIICIALLHTIPFAIFLEIRTSICTIFNTSMSRYLSFVYYPILSGILPIFMASLFSILAFRNVRRIVRRQVPIVRRRLDRQLTAMVLVRVILFVILTLPYAIQRIYSFNSTADSSDALLYAINILVSAIMSTFFNLNYATPFYIFMASSTRFRRQVKHVWIKKFWRRWKRWCCCNENQVNPVGEIRSTASGLEVE